MTETLKGLRYTLYVIFRPFDGFYDLKHEKRGNIKSAFVIVGFLTFTFILRRQLTGFLFNYNRADELNLVTESFNVILPFFVWSISNWCLTTLMDGEGSFKEIMIATAYSLTPLILMNIPMILISNALIAQEAAFYYFMDSVSVTWAAFLLIVGTMQVHGYTMRKNLLTIVLIIIGMGLIIFIGLLFFSVIQQMLNFAVIITREISLRF